MKRGERATHRVRFEWTNGIKGTEACHSLDQATAKAALLRRYGDAKPDADITVTIEPITRKA